MYKTILIISTLLLVIISKQTKKFQISRSYIRQNYEQTPLHVANLLFIIDRQYGQASSQIQLIYENIIESSQLQKSEDKVFITLNCEQTNQTFFETIIQQDLIKKNYKEILNVITNANYEILSINYFQQKLKKRQTIKTIAQVLKNQPAKQPILVLTPIKQKGSAVQAQAQQSFFSKYKYYIIAFGLVFFLLGNMDPQKMNQNLRQAQEQRR